MPPERSAPAEAPSSTPDLKFEVEYAEFGGQAFPADRRGRGKLIISEPGPAANFALSGPPPPSLSLGQPIEFTFSFASIRSVEVRGNLISFTAVTNGGLADPQPFSFYCVTAADTAAVARWLPALPGQLGAGADDFQTQLDQLPAADSFWTSVTGLIVIANVIAFVALGLAGAGWFQVADMQLYVRFGANQATATTDGQWWRLVSSMFLHYGILHLLLNMWALLQAGQLVEKLTGRALYVLVFLGSGILGSLTTLVWHGKAGAWSAGASGAVFGVYGALIGFMLRQRQTVPEQVRRPVLKGAVAFAAYNLVFGFLMPGVDNAAHLGGLIGGLSLGALVALPLDPEIRRRLTKRRFLRVSIVLSAAIAAGVWAVLRAA